MEGECVGVVRGQVGGQLDVSGCGGSVFVVQMCMVWVSPPGL